MENQSFHPSDKDLLLELEGELSAQDSKKIRAHLAACWECRSRSQSLESAITNFTRFHIKEFESSLPPATGPRALLKARLAQLSTPVPDFSSRWRLFFGRRSLPLVATGCMAAAIAFWTVNLLWLPTSNAAVVLFPNAKLTPGAALIADRQTVCRLENVKNKEVPTELKKRVFEEYGIRNAKPQLYEVDYLVTPALGGADDIRNLWPQSYSADWNAKVKDDLEDLFRDKVCDGTMDLAEAQKEIAGDWIAAYKHYFHTDKPLATHQ